MLNNLLVARRQVLMIAILTGRFSDRYTWFSRYAPYSDCLLDLKLKPKLAWNAMTKAFDHALKRCS
ncbi:hypothetical protein GS682_23905 [Nostoc sp. B(2019)]|nr:hypothetical protein [Nostoc sp. B(2019)]